VERGAGEGGGENKRESSPDHDRSKFVRGSSSTKRGRMREKRDAAVAPGSRAGSCRFGGAAGRPPRRGTARKAKLMSLTLTAGNRSVEQKGV
jgi:hypothetical protein